MADPLSVTASVIAVATLAFQSCKATYSLIDGLAGAPQAIARSKTSFAETQTTINALQQTLTTNSEPPSGLDSILGTIDLEGTLKSVQRLCDEFATAITSFTSHSTDGKFSKRDRVAVNLHESKISNLDRQLGYCQQTLSMVLVSINLIVATRTADDLQRLDDRFQAQEQALANLDTQLYNCQKPPPLEECSACDRDADLQLIAELRKLCQDALSTTITKRTGQKFGDMSTDDQSLAMQGIVGDAHDGVEQSFGKMTTSKNSRAFQGQIDASSFAAMFGKR
ncbi:hypothetical protein PHISCL_09887 [Aspergillus sclerotialis]|uniref:Azaphilone pigments biosynthesis cluster protein L N-terminal domain-containing protein n=1 Tax=Aspergillus sclerotialis TaxID=2070753 RepID=A0A3A2Z4H5_9EURO|nr:hypothetical protein PHISCL_09887 [Aspergillus sclerotialis]